MPVPKPAVTEAKPALSGLGTLGAKLGTMHDVPITLPGPRLPWTWCASPAKLTCFMGHIVPSLTKARFDPGMNGNAPGKNAGEGTTAWFQRQGFTPVPHDMRGLTAFGEPIVSGRSAYLHEFVGVSGPSKVSYWCERWDRPSRMGHITVWEHDPDGRLDFLIRCLGLVQGGELNDAQIQIATRPFVRKAQSLGDRQQTPLTQRLLRQVASHLPAEYAPSHLRPLYEASPE